MIIPAAHAQKRSHVPGRASDVGPKRIEMRRRCCDHLSYHENVKEEGRAS